MAPIDPQPFATNISLSLYFDFLASALLSLPRPFAGTLVLDTRDLSVHSVTNPAPGRLPLPGHPAARIHYSARLNIPVGLSAVMSARQAGIHPPFRGEAPGISVWDELVDGREEFVMNQPIPSYLFAFAVGELGWREVGQRTRARIGVVCAKGVPHVEGIVRPLEASPDEGKENWRNGSQRGMF